MALARTGVVRLAGLSGAAAVALVPYGAYVLNVSKEGVTEEQRKRFEVANRWGGGEIIETFIIYININPSLSIPCILQLSSDPQRGSPGRVPG